MCILAVASTGAEFSRSTLEDMFYANPDGAGWAYAQNGKIYFAKGYTSASKFIKAVQKLPANCERMVHCRIATHGGVCKELTHPFPVSRDYKRMELLSGTLSSGYILAHNGILHNFNPAKNHSDTEELVRCLANIKSDIMGDDLREMINALIDGSRVAILNTNGKINRYGTGWTQDGGIWYSNTYFKYTSTKYNRYYDDEWDDYYNYSGYRNYTASVCDKIPDLKSLEPISEGEVIKNTDIKKAYINVTDGSYLLDAKTRKLYGQYKGTLYTTKYEMCDVYNCAVCEYECPFKDKGGA